MLDRVLFLPLQFVIVNLLCP